MLENFFYDLDLMALDEANDFHGCATVGAVSTVKLERRLGALTADEMSRVLDALAERLRM